MSSRDPTKRTINVRFVISRQNQEPSLNSCSSSSMTAFFFFFNKSFLFYAQRKKTCLCLTSLQNCCVRKLPGWRSSTKTEAQTSKRGCLRGLLSIFNGGECSTDRQTAERCHIFFAFYTQTWKRTETHSLKNKKKTKQNKSKQSKKS